MRASNRITEITEEHIQYIAGSPLAIKMCNITHTPVHVHNSATELVYCLSGHVDIICNHERVRINSGEIFTVEYYDVHCLRSDADNITLIIHLDFTSTRASLGKLVSYIDCADITCSIPNAKALNEIKQHILAVAYLRFCNELTEDTATVSAGNLSKALQENFNWFGVVDSHPNNNREMAERIVEVVNYVLTNYKEKLSLSYFANTLSISENYASQFFKKSPYGSFSNLVGYVRCYLAQRLLISSELSVLEISDECGFSDYKYFYKHFNYWWKTSPHEFRKLFREYVSEPDSTTVIEDYEARIFLSDYISKLFARLYI